MQSVSPEYFVTDFYKKVFVSYCKKMQNHSNFSISMFGDEFTDDEMGRITGIEAKNKEIIITEKNPINHGNKISSDDDLINIVKAKRKK